MGTLNRIFKNRIAIRIEKDTMQYWGMGHQWSLLADIYIYIYSNLRETTGKPTE